MLASGTPRGAAQLLDSMQLQNLIAEAREDYNLVVLTGQPVEQAIQTMVLANVVDMVVLVVGANRSKRHAVRDAVNTVVAASKKPPVVALNRSA